jgi:SAM-dependent methyltransferase
MKSIFRVKLALKKLLFSNRFKLTHRLQIPMGYTESELFNFVTSIRVDGAPEHEMFNYGTHDFKRFIYTLGLVANETGECLELGSNPYFTTLLLEKFTNLNIQKANYFGSECVDEMQCQRVFYKNIDTNRGESTFVEYKHFNIESDEFPYDDDIFDVVIFAEIIEHLLNDPCKVLREINRILKMGGTLVLTTPNVARLENIAKLIAGNNLYDPYSGYGAYGRHNREYNRHELNMLLQHEGFKVTECFTSDVHKNNADDYFNTNKIIRHLKYRENDLGQYIFIKAVKSKKIEIDTRPNWLYRSYPEGSLD